MCLAALTAWYYLEGENAMPLRTEQPHERFDDTGAFKAILDHTRTPRARLQSLFEQWAREGVLQALHLNLSAAVAEIFEGAGRPPRARLQTRLEGWGREGKLDTQRINIATSVEDVFGSVGSHAPTQGRRIP